MRNPFDTGAERVAERPLADPVVLRGSNQSGMRAHNERLVLSLLRTEGPMAKSDLARLTGLSAQTVSVIMRSLEADGLLVKGEPVRGRIGQPSVPMALEADGAFFLGLKIGRRSADLMLVDFLGKVRDTRRNIYRYPTPDAVIAFVREALPSVLAALDPAQRDRVGGMGIAMPFQLWNWVAYIGAPQSQMDQWRNRDIQSEIAEVAGMPVYIQNDATAACGAELVFGAGEKPKDFLYFYFGTFIGGGLVLNGRLFPGRTGNAGGVGPMPVPGPDGGTHRLFDVASMSRLAEMMEEAGESSDHLWQQHREWRVSRPILEAWIDGAAQGLAYAILSAAALTELEAVLIDGWMPADIRTEITTRTEAALDRLDMSGVERPLVRQGTVGADARALGAAAIPLAQRYLIENTALPTVPTGH